MLKNGVGVPERKFSVTEEKIAGSGSSDGVARKQPQRTARKAATTRGRAELYVSAEWKIPRLILLCVEKFTVLPENVQLGRLQLWMNGNKLSTSGTLFSEGVKPGALIYVKVLEENDMEIEGVSFSFCFAVPIFSLSLSLSLSTNIKICRRNSL